MKAPAFLFYAGDFLSSPDVQAMDTREVGAYCLLLFNAWQGDLPGHLPNNENRLRRMTRLTVAEWEVSRDLLLGKFPVADMGLTRYNPRMVAEAEKQAVNRAKKAAAGKQGGRPAKKQTESENNRMLSEQKHMLSKHKANEKQTESLSISITESTNVDKASMQREADLPSAESKPAEYRYDEAPVFLSRAFAAHLKAIGYGHVDWALYLLRIAQGAQEAVMAKKIPELATDAKWKTYVQRWLDNDKRRGHLLLPDAAADLMLTYVAPPRPAEALNHAFLAEQQAKAEARQAAHFARYSQPQPCNPLPKLPTG